MAGNILQKYGTAATLTVTSLQSLASSSSFLSGWTSAWIDNTTDLDFAKVISGNIAAGTSPTAGSVRVYLYAANPDGTGPDIFSSGTEGTEGAASVHDSEVLDASLVLVWSSSIDTTSDQNYPVPPRSARQAFGYQPRKFAIYVAHDTVNALKSSANAFAVDGELAQYT